VLYLNNGVYGFRPVVPEEWVTASLTNYTSWKNESIGKMINVGYGYLWWLGEIGGHKVFAALGYAGQIVCCVPDLNMVIATSAPSDVDARQADIQMSKIIAIIADYIIPAVK
jgi:CubicO group peptidase (beta-lactamase class C family)